MLFCSFGCAAPVGTYAIKCGNENFPAQRIYGNIIDHITKQRAIGFCKLADHLLAVCTDQPNTVACANPFPVGSIHGYGTNFFISKKIPRKIILLNNRQNGLTCIAGKNILHTLN